MSACHVLDIGSYHGDMRWCSPHLPARLLFPQFLVSPVAARRALDHMAWVNTMWGILWIRREPSGCSSAHQAVTIRAWCCPSRSTEVHLVSAEGDTCWSLAVEFGEFSIFFLRPALRNTFSRADKTLSVSCCCCCFFFFLFLFFFLFFFSCRFLNPNVFFISNIILF